MKQSGLRWFSLLLMLFASSSVRTEVRAAGSEAESVDKTAVDTSGTQVLRLLQTHCFECHGPEAREGGLRLTSRNYLLLRNDSGQPALVAGNSEQSELIRRVTSEDDQRMPPDGERLSDSDVQLLRNWIQSGAPWPIEGQAQEERHWAYIVPVRPEMDERTGHPIDQLVQTKLQNHPSGLKPSAPEIPARLLRRVYLDLIGLPPTPQEVRQFEANPSSTHFEQIVDRLLASPHYGEKWARHWLDLARYADSNGYQADQFRSVWAYRDWVIQAFNADMPFDQFTIEQMAGDLLPDAQLSQVVATGFHRLTTCNVEAGVDPEENRTNQVADRVTTTGTVWLGTTLECARCHNHKYDPFTQQDFYQLFAFFNNTPMEVEQQGNGVQFEVAGPMLPLPLPDDVQRRQTEQQEELSQLQRQLQQRRQTLTAYDARWEAELLPKGSRPSQWHPLTIAEFHSASATDFERLDDGSILLTGPAADKDVYTIVIDTQLTDITGIRLEALTHPSLPGNGPGRTDARRPNFILYEVEASIAAGTETTKPATATASTQADASATATAGTAAETASSGIPQVVPLPSTEPLRFRSATADYFQPNWNPAGLIDGNPTTGWAIGTEFGKPHEVTLLTESPVGFENGSRLTLRLPQHFGRGRLIGRLRFSAMTGQPSRTEIPADVQAALAIKPDQRSKEHQQAISDLRQAQDPQLTSLQAKIKTLEDALAAITPDTTAVMTEMSEKRASFIFKRGDFLTHGPEVKPWTPTVLHAFSPDQPENQPADRLDLARWLVSRDNPLTARVTVNRWWSEFFGVGIVDTLEDFGTQGSRPSHPELLDWLAVELMDHHWSMKHIHKRIVTSATYQQSSRITADQLESDPHNVLLARGPRFRLSAEVIRDNALAVSGLLSDKMGGPPVYPPQPENIWRHVGRNAPKYQTDTSEDRYRRGIYVVWRRSAPYPSFVNFDAPDRASCVVQRSRSNTPLQALTLLNDPAYVEMAIALAARVLQEQPMADLRTQLEYAMRLCVARTPETEEILTLQSLWTEEQQRFANDLSQAEKLIPDDQRLASVLLSEQAAWCSIANVLLNLDEVITKN